MIDASGHEVVYNPYARRLRPGEVAELLSGCDAVIAGTEPYGPDVIAQCPRLKVIARVGIGLDSVDLPACREHGVTVTYTPDAPSQAVAELTLAMMLNLLRHVQTSDRSVRERAWNRLMGRLMEEVDIGIIGVGRIGSRVVKLLQPFGCTIRMHDIEPHPERTSGCEASWTSYEEILRRSGIISLHIPLTPATHGLIGTDAIARMLPGTLLINTSRGSIIDEGALVKALQSRHLGGAALDVFEAEPYEGPLARLENTILTAHMGASANRARFEMERGAAEDCLRVLAGQPPLRPAP